MRKTVALALLLSTPALAAPPDVESRVNQLLSQMTVAEKFGQLQQLDGFAEGPYRAEHPEMIRRGQLGSTLNVRSAARTNKLQHIAMDESRMKIPVLFAFDVIHGYRTIFPSPLGETASWDPAMARAAASIAAAEAYSVGVRWVFAPMVDVARDPRWGRVMEGSGEDPFLGCALARARVEGFQGDDPSQPGKVVACAKHWVAYGAAQAGRDYNTTDVSEESLRETYFPPFKAAVDSGVATFMSAFNDLNGVPASANPFTLTTVLRGEWGFDGIVVSDYTAVEELLKHGVAATPAEAVQKALTAGVDVEMVSKLYAKYGPELLAEGKLDQAVLDRAVARVLRVKLRLGLFEHPYTDPDLEAKTLLTPASRAAARRAGARSMVLLKNEHEALPLSKSVRRVAVVGALADSALDIIGSWNGDGRARDSVTAVEGIRRKLPGAEVRFARGAGPHGGGDLKAALAAARWADVTVVVVGESADMTGEATSRSDIALPGNQEALVQALHALGKPYVVVLMNGRPLTIEWMAEHSPAILESWFPGTEGGNALADVLFGDVNPGGKLPMTFPRSVGQIPIYYNHKNTGRPSSLKEKYTSRYIDVTYRPRYPFGYGLSYTRFAISDLALSAAGGKEVTVTARATNVGKRTGDEVVQLYLRRRGCSVTRPVRELKGFSRVTLKPGESRTVQFHLGPDELSFWRPTDLAHPGAGYQWVEEAGPADIFVGDSAEATMARSFKVMP